MDEIKYKLPVQLEYIPQAIHSVFPEATCKPWNDFVNIPDILTSSWLPAPSACMPLPPILEAIKDFSLLVCEIGHWNDISQGRPGVIGGFSSRHITFWGLCHIEVVSSGASSSAQQPCRPRQTAAKTVKVEALSCHLTTVQGSRAVTGEEALSLT